MGLVDLWGIANLHCRKDESTKWLKHKLCHVRRGRSQTRMMFSIKNFLMENIIQKISGSVDVKITPDFCFNELKELYQAYKYLFFLGIPDLLLCSFKLLIKPSLVARVKNQGERLDRYIEDVNLNHYDRFQLQQLLPRVLPKTLHLFFQVQYISCNSRIVNHVAILP